MKAEPKTCFLCLAVTVNYFQTSTKFCNKAYATLKMYVVKTGFKEGSLRKYLSGMSPD